jgi:uncharacterized DUF497 family protein
MEIEFDAVKDEANVAKHGVSLALAAELNIIRYAKSQRGHEKRIRAFGLIGGKFYCLVFTFRPNAIRVISLRRAHREEVEEYE